MDAKKLQEVVDFYKRSLQCSYLPKRCDENSWHLSNNEKLQHCYWMLEEMNKMIETDIGKAFRWLGFIQGTLWSLNYNSIMELRTHSRSK